MPRNPIFLNIPPGIPAWEAENWRRIRDALNMTVELDNAVNSPTVGMGVTGSKVKIDANDTVANYLENKLVAGPGITLTEGLTGGTGEKIMTAAAHVAVTLPTDSGLELSGQEINMGTPTGITAATTNSVTTSTHAHSVSLALDDLSNVDVTSPTDDDIIRYDSATQTWQHEALPVAGGSEPALGNPAADDYVLSSKMDGTRSWVEMTGGSGGADILEIQVFS